MLFFYNISIRSYFILIYLASFFNKKAKLWIDGRKNIFEQIKSKINNDRPIAWIHCSSLGEFEQGRPVIEQFKRQFPTYRILLTFFSPSGYEVRKNYAEADYIFYLPLDTKSNANQFINIVKPSVVFFVKYEFWFHYLNALKRTSASVYIFSAIFRENQIFFQWYGSWYRNILKVFNHLFVQNIESERLLKSIGITNVTIMGDTRFDRVFEIASTAKPLSLVEHFKNDHFTIIAGSTWGRDEDILAEYANKLSSEYRIIIAPHEISEDHVQRLCKLFHKPCVRFSKATIESVSKAEVLIVDGIGYLSSLYQYGNVAYIGGGFGKGIHNVLEAATFGLPVIFGPNYHKFQEAKDLIRMHGAFAISSPQDLKQELNRLINDRVHLMQSGFLAKKYVDANKGATQKILQQVKENIDLRLLF